MHGGVIADVDGATEVLEAMLCRTIWRTLFHPQVLACVPADASDDERGALRTAITRSCASDVTFIPETLAAAIGAGVEIWSPYAQMLVDFGEGVTDTAIIRSGELVDSATLRIGCSDLRNALIDYADRELAFPLQENRAEDMVRQVCQLAPGFDPANCTNGELKIEAAYQAMQPVMTKISRFITEFFRELPNSVAVEVIDSGVTATGGGALLPLLIDVVRLDSGLTISVPVDPIHAVIRGAAKIISH
jgi:rod shape-determining protein MreB